MNIHTRLAALLCCLALPVLSQAQQYSYISDRTFTSPDQLMGYDFKPAMREVPGEEPEEFPVGRYSFGITRKNLYVEGPGIRGVYNLNEINTTEYGFILKTMNARDPTVQGHLKIVVDDLGQVEGLIFKRSTHEHEVIFFLRVIPEEVDEQEAEYFTNLGQQRIRHVDSLWTGVEVRPFLRIFNNMGGIQQRITMRDSTYLRFYKVVTVEEKERRGLGKRLGLAGGDVAAGAAGSSAADAEGADAETDGDGGLADAKRPRGPRLRLGRKARAEASAPAAPTAFPDTTSAAESPADTLPAGQREHVEAVATLAPTDSIAAVDPVSMEAALGIAFDPATGDTLALTGPDSLAVVGAPADSLAADTLGPDVKVKITIEYFVDLNSFMRFDDGHAEMQHRTYLVNGILERENPGARKGGDRYQWELNLHKQPNAYVYLDEEYRVNSIYIDGQTFHMRGY